jgi:hypothetical protein
VAAMSVEETALRWRELVAVQVVYLVAVISRFVTVTEASGLIPRGNRKVMTIPVSNRATLRAIFFVYLPHNLSVFAALFPMAMTAC